MSDLLEHWVIGDVQGCLYSLQHLLAQPGLLDNPKAHFYFAGDMINRGSASLQVLEYIDGLGARAQCVLGNHDIHFLSVASGKRRANRLDTFEDILQSPRRHYWVDWLRHQPLCLEIAGHLIVHAGIDPRWSLQDLYLTAHEIEQLLQSDEWGVHLLQLFGNEPAQWSRTLSGYERLRYGLNVITRIRYMLRSNLRLNFSDKGAPAQADKSLIPWFEVTPRKISQPIVFGHWSTLGLLSQHNVYALDTGALWGGQLTAMRIPDGKMIQVPAQEPQALLPQPSDKT